MRSIITAWAAACILAALVGAGHCDEALSLQQAVDIALKQNPGLLAAKGEASAAQSNKRGARSLANPEMVVAPTVAGEPGSGSDTAALLVQPLEVNGQRQARGRVAHYEAQASQAAYQSTQRDVVRSTKQAYWDVAQAQRMVTLDQANVEFAKTLYQAATRQLDVGSASGGQAIKAQVELARANQELARAEADLSNAKAVLNTLMGRAPETSLRTSDDLVFTPLAAGSVQAGSETRRPELAEAQALLSARKSDVRLAETRRLPDLLLQARQETFGGAAGVAIGVVFPLLDWGSIKADRQRAEAESTAQAHRVDAVRNTLRLDTDLALREVKRTETLIAEYQQSVVSQAEQLAEMARKGYKAGATSYLEVLEAQRTLRTTTTEYYSALADHMKALAQLEWALGVDGFKETSK